MDSATADSVQEAALWQRWRREGDAEARQRLLDIHLGYARIVAAALFARRYDHEVEFADFLQLASIGLLEAMDRFDPDRGVQFRTFASRRMQGAILSGLERMTEKQQQIAARKRMRAERVGDVKALAGEQADAPRHPRELMRYVSEVGIGLALCWMLDDTAMIENPAACVTVPFYRSAALEQLQRQLAQAIEALPPAERLVLKGHYVNDLPFERIAAVMQLTRGRVSQIHKQALLRLRCALREHADWASSF
jgi:RNA polymerase sigma factor for flagellar operon FliA